MSMNPHQMQAVQAWINTRIGWGCPICKGQSFTFQDQVVLQPIASKEQPDGTPKTVIPISCTDCAYTILLSESLFHSQEGTP